MVHRNILLEVNFLPIGLLSKDLSAETDTDRDYDSVSETQSTDLVSMLESEDPVDPTDSWIQHGSGNVINQRS